MGRVVVEVFVIVIIGALIGHGLSMAGVDLFGPKEEKVSDMERNRDQVLRDCYEQGGWVKYTVYAKTKLREESEEWACQLP